MADARLRLSRSPCSAGSILPPTAGKGPESDDASGRTVRMVVLRMLRTIGRTALEIARAIDTGHAIRHGVPRKKSPKALLPSAELTSEVAHEQVPVMELESNS